VTAAAFKNQAYANKYRDSFGVEQTNEEIDEEITMEYRAGSNRSGVQGAHLNPLGLFLEPPGPLLRTSIPCIWGVLSASLPA
jgi:hypothetical protein